jgi:hypothetical protein
VVVDWGAVLVEPSAIPAQQPSNQSDQPGDGDQTSR